MSARPGRSVRRWPHPEGQGGHTWLIAYGNYCWPWAAFTSKRCTKYFSCSYEASAPESARQNDESVAVEVRENPDSSLGSAFENLGES